MHHNVGHNLKAVPIAVAEEEGSESEEDELKPRGEYRPSFCHCYKTCCGRLTCQQVSLRDLMLSQWKAIFMNKKVIRLVLDYSNIFYYVCID